MEILLDPNVLLIVAGCCLLGISSGVIGVFSFLQKKALFSDAVAHAVLPGVALAFILSGQKNPLILIAGALVSGWLALASIDIISSKSKIKPDTAIGIALSFFFGTGILLLTSIQQSGAASQSGLDSFLFGKAASMQQYDVITFIGFAAVLIIVVILFFKEFKLIIFNREYAISIGLPVRTFDLLLSTLNVLAVAIGIQSVGVVLMSALLISPAGAARFWTNDLIRMLFLVAVSYRSCSRECQPVRGSLWCSPFLWWAAYFLLRSRAYWPGAGKAKPIQGRSTGKIS
ncbi:MAG: iron chelate uptake ABC transporter family permease subunit [Bacteroidota bacterium]